MCADCSCRGIRSSDGDSGICRSEISGMQCGTAGRRRLHTWRSAVGDFVDYEQKYGVKIGLNIVVYREKILYLG